MTTTVTPSYTAAVVGVDRAGEGTSQKDGGHQIGYTHAGMYQRSARAAHRGCGD